MAKTKAANGRSLPKKRNPLLDASKTPSYNDLVQRRRLGRTDLHVKAAQVGTNSATAPENLGTIEYAYLGAPLPDSLQGSEIFVLVGDAPPPVEYYMMRRSKDGFVSATGMFKVAFPWAKHSEERAERDYLQTLSSTSADEQAGNIWINEAAALALSDEYGIRQWIEALLDPALPSTDSHKVKNGDVINPPPRFEFTAGGSGGKMASPASPARVKKSKKSESPTKSAKPSESPKKRLTKAEKEARAKAAQAASESLQSALDTAASVADSESVVDGDIEGPKINGTVTPASLKPKKKSEKKKKKAPASSTDDDKVVVQVDSTIEQQGDVERTHTNVRVKMPADNPELPMPENTEQMIADAKKMVEEARKLDGSTTSSSKKGKRKAEQIEAEDDDVAVDAAAAKAEGRELQPAKKARLMEQQARSQRVRSRALMGLAATLTVGAIAPYFLG